MAKINISEFSIRIRLDSKSAVKGLKSLETKLKTFQHYLNQALSNERAKIAALSAQGTAIKGNLSKQKKLNKENKKSVKLYRQMSKSLSSMRNMGRFAIGFLALRSVFQTIKDTVIEITKAGMKYRAAMVTIEAAVAGTDLGASLSPENLKKLQRQQRLFIQHMATQMGLDLGSVTSEYAKFYAAASPYIGVEDSERLFKGMAKVGVVYGLTQEKMSRAFTAFTQIASKNQVMAEEVKQQLGDVLPGAMEIFSRAMTKTGKYGTVTVARLYEMMQRGGIVAADVLPAVADELERLAMANNSFAKAMEEPIVKLNRVKSMWSIFSTGALNQFSDALGNLLEKITKLLSGKGFATATGQWIKTLLQDITFIFEDLFNKMDEFEEKWAKATTEEKWKLLRELPEDLSKTAKETLFNALKVVAGWFKDFLVLAFNAIEASDIARFTDMLKEVLTDIFQSVWDNIKLFGGGDDPVKKMNTHLNRSKVGSGVHAVTPSQTLGTNTSAVQKTTMIMKPGAVHMEVYGQESPAEAASKLYDDIMTTPVIPSNVMIG